MPDIENNRKTAEKGAEWVPVKQPKNHQKNSRDTRKTTVLTVFRVFRLFFRLFFGYLTGTHSAPFSAVFRLFSMSGTTEIAIQDKQHLAPHTTIPEGIAHSIFLKGISLDACCVPQNLQERQGKTLYGPMLVKTETFREL